MRRQLSWPGYTRMSSYLATSCTGAWENIGQGQALRWCLPESWCDFSALTFSNLTVPCSLLRHRLSCPEWPAEGSLYFPMLYWNKSWPLPGMEWACLSPKCKCHFSTSLVTTPFLAFIGNDIFLCSLSPTHAAGQHGQLLCFKRLKRKCWDL